MSELMKKLKEIATIEGIEAEQQELRAKAQAMQNEIDSLEVFRLALIVERDGKPPARTRSRKKGAQSISLRDDEAAEVTEAKTRDAESQSPEPVKSYKDDPGLPCVERCLKLLANATANGLAAGEISHILKIPYGTVYGAINRDSRFTNVLGKWSLKKR